MAEKLSPCSALRLSASSSRCDARKKPTVSAGFASKELSGPDAPSPSDEAL